MTMKLSQDRLNAFYEIVQQGSFYGGRKKTAFEPVGIVTQD